ncbi:MAG: hypothetical protein HY823_05005 [Acidobacteria bacterium]|nr:hypothetical protein [Acidobacteriota bacterium]
MASPLLHRIRWALGILLAWTLGWTMLGVPVLHSMLREPHPYLKGVPLSGVILRGALEWSLGTLLTYGLLGLFLGLISQLVSLQRKGTGSPVIPGFNQGLLIGLGGFLGFHGWLYLQVPGALDAHPLLARVPMGLALLLLLGGGLAAYGRTFRRSGLGWPGLRALLALGMVGAPLLAPHDLFRRGSAPAERIPETAPRLLVLSFDGLRRDLYEKYRPAGRVPGGATSITSLPATRKAWLSLLGADPAQARDAVVMADENEFKDPGALRLLKAAQARGLRTAFVINDSLTPAFGLQPNLFTEVLEPEGGWKYWFTLGFGGSWPAWSWAQNFLSPVETSNPWNDPEAFHRDVDGALARNAWVSTHNCALHVPLVLTLPELVSLEGWGWLVRPALRFRPYTTLEEVASDHGARLHPQADALRHYEVRVERLARRIGPWLERWARAYPQLSAVVTSDHGSLHVPLPVGGGPALSHLSGLHGFVANAPIMYVPLEPFGRTRSELGPDQVHSWWDLRDSLLRWVQTQEPLVLRGRREGWLVQFPSVDSGVFLGSGGEGKSGSLDVKELAQATLLLPTGAWWVRNRDFERFRRASLTSALVTPQGIITFFPVPGPRYIRDEYAGLNIARRTEVSHQEMLDEVGRFAGARPQAVPER